MTADLNETLSPDRRSWIEAANEAESNFPVQNLPYGVFTRIGSAEIDRRLGVAIGDQILDLKESDESGLLEGLSPEARCAIHAKSLNDLMRLGRRVWSEVRVAVSSLLEESNPKLRDNAAVREELLVPMAEAQMHLPATIGDYTDFYASIHHATNVGSMFRPDNPLLPNYKYLPVAYHGRASSIVPSGTPIRRPKGQIRPNDGEPPAYAPSRLLDYELEMGFFVGPGNELSSSIDMTNARNHMFGMVLVNDWSARDIQKWEYQPLGPFNAKNFATSISPWVVTLDALAPFRVKGPPRAADDPPVLDYLKPLDDYSLEIICEVWLRSERMRSAKPQAAEALRVSRGNFRDMYWTIAQMLVHHTSTGCNLKPGDMIASGTISGPEEESRGCLLERTWRGERPIQLPDGTQRTFLQDGDEVIIRAYCEKTGAARIGFGECRGVILAAD